MNVLSYLVAEISGPKGNLHVIHQRVGTLNSAQTYNLSEHASSHEAVERMRFYEIKHNAVVSKVREALAYAGGSVSSDDAIAAFLKQNGVI